MTTTTTALSSAHLSGAVTKTPVDTFAESRSYSDRSNCARAMKIFAGANLLSPDEFRVKSHGPKDFRFQRLPIAGAKAQDGIPDFLKIPQNERNEAWIKNPPKAAPAPGVAPAAATRKDDDMARKINSTTKSARKSGKVASRTKSIRPGTKLELVIGLLTRKEGCTTADILKITKWPSVSVHQQARAAGLTVRQQKVGKVTRYWGVSGA